MYQPTLARFTARDPLPDVGQSILGGLRAGAQAALLEQYVYASTRPQTMIDPSGMAPDICDCCEAAIADAAVREGAIRPAQGRRQVSAVVTGASGRRCRVTIRCTSRGCPQNFPATTSQPRTGPIQICMDCRMANANLEQTIRHEMQHARDFCDRRPQINLDDCLQYERSAYEESCGYIFPVNLQQRDRCIECGVYFSCQRFGAAAPAPPCDLSGGVPTKPCWKYVHGEGFVPDPDDPRCPQQRE